MTKEKTPTKEEWQKYKHQYLLNIQQSSNVDMEEMFGKANDVGQKITSILVTISGVLLTIAGGILATGDIKISYFAKVVFAIGMLTLFLSILAGLWAFRSMQKFYLEWAQAKHARGNMVEGARIETFDDLVTFRESLMAFEKGLPETSSKLPSTLQFIFFGFGLLMILLTIGNILLV